jgi:hypothetical protein
MLPRRMSVPLPTTSLTGLARPRYQVYIRWVHRQQEGATMTRSISLRRQKTGAAITGASVIGALVVGPA